jgi:hypothetical protein
LHQKPNIRIAASGAWSTKSIDLQRDRQMVLIAAIPTYENSLKGTEAGGSYTVEEAASSG